MAHLDSLDFCRKAQSELLGDGTYGNTARRDIAKAVFTKGGTLTIRLLGENVQFMTDGGLSHICRGKERAKEFLRTLAYYVYFPSVAAFNMLLSDIDDLRY